MNRVSFLPPYISLEPLAAVLGVLLILTAAASWTSVGVDWALLDLAGEVRSGAEVTRGERLAHERVASIANGVQLACTLLTAVLFLTWLYQARVNVRALGARKLRWRREWTVLSFLIPVLNVVRPYQVIREVWQASDPRSLEPLGWQRLWVPPLVTRWWLCLLVFVSFELLAWTVLLGVDTAGERRLAYTLRALADTSAGVAASLSYFVTARITEAQEQKHALLRHTDPATLEFDPDDALVI